MSITSQEKILVPLRELYRRDKSNRKLIAEYANNFKQRNVFLYKEAKFLSERLSVNQIDFDKALLPVKLLTVELVPKSCWFSLCSRSCPDLYLGQTEKNYLSQR